MCWGRNDHGQLGTGETSTLPTMSPVPVVSISSANSVAAGCNHTCAVIAGNTLNCWGFNGGGQVGDGTTTTPRSSPRFVMTISGAEQVSGGFLHSCARLGDGSTRCWGFNDEGQVGDGTTTPRDVPVAVSSVSGISDIDAATCWSSSCAVDADGNAWCWRANGNGQLGDNTMTPRDAPVAVRSLDDAQQISVGNEHACAVRDSGAVVCWGNNSNGQLGDGTTFIRETFVSVDSALPTRASRVSAGGQHTCALLDDGDVYCWGANDVGQVGDGSSIERLTPVRVPAPGE